MEYKRGRTDGRSANDEGGTELLHHPNSILARKYMTINGQKIYASTLVIYTAAEVKKPAGGKSQQGSLTVHSNNKELQAEAEAIFKDPEILLRNELSIIPKKAVWEVRIDLLVAMDQGGLIELATQGIYAALKALSEAPQTPKTPKTLLRPIPAPRFVPRTLTASLVENGWVYSPTEKEREEGEGNLTLTLNNHKDIVFCSFVGSAGVDTLCQEIDRVIGHLSEQE
ncbi:exosome complex component RRP45 [Nematocida displodere]|uniref:Exosome complex component RRP45 n=1 Tax=Nematocida displodere TaxID=1805483 RepID=A0A177ECB4_9MICR|nr:exosome complex component RRP45 [Nematocida displodere]